jgi:hypothetical protein
VVWSDGRRRPPDEKWRRAGKARRQGGDWAWPGETNRPSPAQSYSSAEAGPTPLQTPVPQDCADRQVPEPFIPEIGAPQGRSRPTLPC